MQQFLFVSATKIYQLKEKDSEIKKHSLCLGSTSRDLPAKSVFC